ncbi:zinc ABC transporter substrate-binding protein [Rhodobacter sp. CZR27]|uniref:zinc ABC transporter substrate-binding protein n=1 Tax=Rhodobacter sp. CZR27 TaxID=2033869 RepID=UPI000BBEC727|nr:zinc ABC transporter substrate-binding protein [Rhodobacter sp. CZR27]
MRYTISFALASLLAGPAAAEAPRVVTDLPPVHSLVAQVMGEVGQPELLLDRGADAHSFQLRPSQARALAEADLVVWIGPEMTPWLERGLDGEARPQLRLAEVAGTHHQEFGSHEAHHHEDEHEGHGHEGSDPHLWLDPGNAQVWLGAIAAELGRLDPDHAAAYAENAARAQAAVKTLEAETAARLAPARGVPFYVFHDAYGYFAAHFGLTVAGSIAGGDAAAPGAAHLAELRAEMEGTARCLFPEAQHDPKLVRRVAEDAGAKLGPALDPEGSLLEPGPDLYASLIRDLAEGIAGCVAP